VKRDIYRLKIQKRTYNILKNNEHSNTYKIYIIQQDDNNLFLIHPKAHSVGSYIHDYGERIEQTDTTYNKRHREPHARPYMTMIIILH